MGIFIKTILFCSLLILSGRITAQKSLDSLKTLLLHSKDDTSRLVYNFNIGEYYWFRRNIPAAIPHLQKAVHLSDYYRYYPYQVNALNLLANAKLKLEEFDSTLYYLKLALNKSEQHKKTRFLPLIYETYHHIYYELGDYNTALSFALQAADGYENSKEPIISKQAVYAYISIGQIFRELGQPDKALRYFDKALEKGKQTGRASHITGALLNMANVYKTTNKLSVAKQMFDTVIILDKTHYNHESSMFAYEGLGQIALQQEEHNKAISYFESALKYAKEGNENFYQDNLMAQLAKAYFLVNDFKAAKKYFNQSLQVAIAAKDIRSLYTTYGYLAETEKDKGNYEKSLNYREISQQLKDSLLSTEKIRFTNNLETFHRTQHNENKILHLQTQQANTAVSLTQRNRLLWISGTLLLTVISVFFLYYRNSRYKGLISRQQQQLQKERIDALENEKKLVSLQSLLEGQEVERTRLARDLHDSLGSLLSIIKIRIKTNSSQSATSYQPAELLAETLQLTDDAINELRRISHNLAPEVLLKLGLKEAVLQLCNQIKMKTNLKITVQAYGLDERLPVKFEMNLFRITQELLQNIIRHAEPTEVIVQLNKVEKQLTLTVEDNGKGFENTVVKQNTNLGLANISSRVQSMDGRFTLDSEPGVGTSATIEVQLPAITSIPNLKIELH